MARIARSQGETAAPDTLFRDCLSQRPDMRILLDRPGLILAAQHGAHLACGEDSIILGHLFRRGEQRAVEVLSPQEAQAIRTSRGQELIEACWGPYIAILDHPDRTIDILRAPWGDLPCYRRDGDGVTFLASDIDLLMACGDWQPKVDWGEVLGQLAHGPLHHHRTCLAGIEQLPAGERWTIGSHGEERDVLWSPWIFASPQRQITNRDEAVDMVRTVAQSCVAARASLAERVLLTLSGGLDSSIVAACLAGQDTPFGAINLVTRDAIGDETHYARQVSQAFGIALAERLRDVSRIDVHRSGARGRPFPCEHTFFMESMRLAHEVAHETGAQVIFNGAGGDNIFCSLQSAGPAADRLLSEGLGRGFLRSVGDISRLAPASIPAVLRDAIARAWLGKPAFRHRPHGELLSMEARAMIHAAPDHPWFQVPPGILPGKALHVWMLAHFRTYVESLDAQSEIPVVAPLLSQPLVETCLTIPSWMWFEDGRNRAIARSAFTGLLPAEILSRRSKGTPGSFIFEIYETHREAIRAMLLDGELARRGLIDLPGVLAILDSRRPPVHAEVSRILAFIDVEAWAAGWAGSSR